MMILYGSLALVLAFIGALYLQIPTFILPLGYGWSHGYKAKRWVFRILALFFFLYYVSLEPSWGWILSLGIPFGFFWIFSLFNANPNLFIALGEKDIIKTKTPMYRPDTAVVGYTNDSGQAICYPIEEMVMPRHILNDLFLEKPILVSFCAACRSTMVYKPVVNGLRLNFEVLGVRRRNMIIRDRETGTVWQQGTGQAVYGKLKGNRLDFYPYQQMSLHDWLKHHPNSYVAHESPTVRKGFVPKNRLMKLLEKATSTLVAPGETQLNGLPLREKVWGLELHGRYKAYPVSGLAGKEVFTDTLANIEIEIIHNPETGHIAGKTLNDGTPLKFQNHRWFGWKEFHPDTEIWKP